MEPKVNQMTWNAASLEKLNELVKDRLSLIREGILLPHDVGERQIVVDRMYCDYCMSVGLEMNIIPDHDTETRGDLPPPGEAMFLDGIIRLRNLWGDKYIDIPEETAARALALGFLP